MDPVLKWPGGKRWLAPVLSELASREMRSCYYEPFLGGAAAFLAIQPAQAVLSDINAELIECLNIVRDSAVEVSKLVQTWPNEEDVFYSLRASRPSTAALRAARFIFLNRTCWGGVMRFNREGQFNVPFGDNGRKVLDAAALQLLSEQLDSATLIASDFEPIVDRAGKDDMVYCDPPYTLKTCNPVFLRYNDRVFTWEDQVRLANACRRARRRGAFVCVSGLKHPSLIKLYPRWWMATVRRFRPISRKTEMRRSVNEVLIMSRKPNSITDPMLKNCRQILPTCLTH